MDVLDPYLEGKGTRFGGSFFVLITEAAGGCAGLTKRALSADTRQALRAS